MYGISICDSISVRKTYCFGVGGGGVKDSQEVIMGPATILPANEEIGNIKHYEKIHLTYRVPL